MYTLKSERLKYEFSSGNGKFKLNRIMNKLSNEKITLGESSSEFVIAFVDGTKLSSNELTVDNIKQNGNCLTVNYKEEKGIKPSLIFGLHKDNKTVRKQLVIDQNCDLAIDFIDLESIDVSNVKTKFSVEKVEGGEIPAFHSVLGQPVYFDSFFVGCEFPATENRIIDGKATVRYYLGKKVGVGFACPVTVTGGAESGDPMSMKTVFYEYIDTISVPIDLRFQFNSWYDYMRDIDENNILVSFKQVHDKLSQYSDLPIASYVVDDGWVDMKAPFWSFNKKFPQGVKKVSEFCKELDSNFGMWLGPRGGYNDVYRFAKRFQWHKNGYVNRRAKDICVASTKYISKLQDFLIEQTKLNDINYWKFDGFALAPCRNRKHDHMVGGYEDMYFVTDMWTKWIELYNALREVKSDIWINMTCYVNVSPWWLQWVNSIWVQNSSDIGFADNVKNQAQVDAEITYRDGRYYDCLCRRKLQVPTKGIYNHEPIYGNEAKVNYTDDEFEKYIYWCIVRGQALNELHLSPSMMNEQKWISLTNAMKCQQENYHILKNAEYYGGDPLKNEAYGYISWDKDENEGIIALRNPDNKKATVNLKLDKNIGTPTSLQNVKCRNIYPCQSENDNTTYNYGSSMILKLKPFESVIIKLKKQ